MLRRIGHAFFLAALIFSCEKRVVSQKPLGSIVPPPEPVESPVCIITFDDNYYEVLGLAKPLMGNYGFKGDCFVICGLVGYGGWSNPKPSSDACMTWEQLRMLADLGWGIYNHSCSHLPLSDSNDIECCYDSLRAHDFDANVFAYPFGQYNDTIVEWVKQNHVAARTTDWGLNEHFFATQVGSYHLKSVQASGSINPARIGSMVDSCISLNKVLILTYHNFCSYPGCTITHKIYIGDFEEVLAYLDSKRDGIVVMTFKEYLNR